MLEKVEISNAEWDVMRVIWALGETTSRQIIEALSDRDNGNQLPLKH